MLNGESGTGKTFALGTLVDWCQSNGKECFYLDLENSLETLLGYWRDPGRGGKEVPSCLHWHRASLTPVTLAQIRKGAKDTGDFTYETLTKTLDADKGKNNPFLRIMEICFDFPDDRT